MRVGKILGELNNISEGRRYHDRELTRITTLLEQPFEEDCLCGCLGVFSGRAGGKLQVSHE